MSAPVITPEMIEAGAKLLDLYCEGSLGPSYSKGVAERIYETMRRMEPQPDA
jgi:hypothetical protein